MSERSPVRVLLVDDQEVVGRLVARMIPCAFGNTVNIAARCQGLTKRLDEPAIMDSQHR